MELVRELCQLNNTFCETLSSNHYFYFANTCRLGCKTNTNCVLGGSALGSRKESCFDSGKRAAKEIVDCVSIKACVDEHVQV